MKKLLIFVTLVGVFTACGNGGAGSADAAATEEINSTTPPPKRDTNPIGIMMGDTTIGINDSLEKQDTLD